MRNVQKITFVTSNNDKAREAELILGVKLRRVSLELDELQEMDLKVIVEHKVRQAYAKLKQPVLVEDVAIYINQWNGFPGPLIKWAALNIGYEQLAKILIKKDRRAEWRVMYAFFDGKKLETFSGSIFGTIAPKPRGGNSWGFDVVFIPKGYTRTFAQMTSAEKLNVSARAIALKKASAFLQRNNYKH